MRRVQGVSYPRSGFNLLAQMLLNYFSADPDREVDPSKTNIAGKFGYCEFYKHCHQVPCSDPGVTFQKNHDFGLQLPVSRCIDYLVLYREPLPSIISYFEAELAWGTVSKSNDTFSYWERYFRKRLEYYQQFRKKWVDSKLASRKIVKYEDLVDRPHEILGQLVSWFEPDRATDQVLIDRIVRSREVRSTRIVTDFRFCSKEFIERIEDAHRILPVRIVKRWLKSKQIQSPTSLS